MDFLPLRVQSIFNNLFQHPDVSQSFSDPSTNPAMTNPNDPNGIIAALMQNQHGASDRLNAMLDSQPTRDQYKPSTMTNIMSRLSGLSASGAAGHGNNQLIGYRGMGKEGSEIIDSGLDKGYNDAMTDWSAKLKPITTLAADERNQNSNNRMTASALLRDQNTDNALKETTRKNQESEKIKREQLDEKYYYASIMQDRYNRPDLDRFMDSDGYIYSFDKKSGAVEPVVNPDTGEKVKGDKLPEPERLRLQQNYALAKIAAQGRNSIATAQTKGTEDRKTEEAKQPNRVEVKKTVPGVAAKPSAKPAKRVKVISPDGKTGTVPEDQLATAIKNGYKVQ